MARSASIALKKHLLRCCAAGLTALASASALALPAELLSQLHHTAWTVKDGAPPEIRALAQTTDGWLWLGSSTGLYRFDGLRFEQIDVTAPGVFRSASISALSALPDGSLWIGYVQGGASRLWQGRLTHYADAEGLAIGPTLVHFEFDGSDRLWALSTTTWKRFDGQRFVAPPAGLEPPASARMVLTDQQGTTWMLTEETLLRLARGADHFEPTGTNTTQAVGLATGADGSVWLMMASEMRRLTPTASSADAADRPRVSFHPEPLIDRDWNLWSVVCKGICRSPMPPGFKPLDRRIGYGTQQVFGAADGLTTNLTMSLLEDREGNLWVGSKRGLDRLRHNNVVRVPTGDAIYYAIAAGDKGSVGVGTDLNAIAPQPYLHIAASTPVPRPELTQRITCQYRDPDGVVWIGGRKGLWRMQGGKFSPVALPAGTQDRLVQAITRDTAGGLWVSLQGDGVYRLHAGQWRRSGGVAGLPERSANVMVTADDGSLWLGYPDNMLVQVRGERARRFSAAQGLMAGPISALHAGSTTLAAGALGLFVLEGERFRRLHSSGADVFQGITGILMQPAGELWLNGQAGLVRVDAAAWRAALAEPARSVDHTLLDAEDGLPGIAQQVRPLPTLVQGSDGRIWIAATDGLAWLDPARLRRNPAAPQVVINRLRSDGREQRDPQAPVLAANTREISIGYTALNLGKPERSRFRYRLLGSADDDWQDAGPRREAFYSHLPPGRYRFQVVAANEDGVWNETGATLAMELLPAFYQTAGFRTLCAAAGLLLLWGAYRLRLRQMAGRLRARLEARMAERERIARDLHDTLLQGIYGLLLHFQVIASGTSGSDPMKSRMDGVLQQADQLLTEGRDRVQLLRQPLPPTHDLGQALARHGAQLAERSAVSFEATLSPQPRGLLPAVQDELWQIGREALNNAFHHARAKHIRLTLTQPDQGLTLTIADDGTGLPADVRASGGREGHWGLQGMRERAQDIGGELSVENLDSGGVRVQLTVPATRAYATPPGSARAHPLRRLVQAAARRMAR